MDAVAIGDLGHTAEDKTENFLPIILVKGTRSTRSDRLHRFGTEPDRIMPVDQIISLFGAASILLPFAALQFGWMPRASISYNTLNLVGSSLLLYVAILNDTWGFILLEVVWGLVSLWGLLRVLSNRGIGSK